MWAQTHLVGELQPKPGNVPFSPELRPFELGTRPRRRDSADGVQTSQGTRQAFGAPGPRVPAHDVEGPASPARRETEATLLPIAKLRSRAGSGSEPGSSASGDSFLSTCQCRRLVFGFSVPILSTN